MIERPAHFTDEHQVTRGSSVDIIERCAAFLRQSGDFMGILDYADENDKKIFHQKLMDLEKEAMRIIRRESKS